MKKQNLFLFLLLFLGNMILYAQCIVNAGGNTTICGTSYTLQGSSGSAGTPTWTLVSKPSGAPDPIISNVNSLTPNVTGITSPGNYVFQVEQDCGISGSATSQVIITAPGDSSTFTAGPDITNVNATTGTVTLNGVVPAGYTASWSAYNIYRWERSSVKTSQNSQFSSTTSATTTFSLINKANHDIDPAYVVTLRITSTNNPNCWYEDSAIVRFIPNPQILPTVSTSRCISGTGNHYVALQSTSPKFSKGYPTSPGSSGNFGTTITMNVISQPSGGNISYSNIYDDNIYFTGANVVGVYKFTLTVANASGTYTTPEITYTFTGTTPNPVNFLVPSRPEQMMIYDSGNSGGEVHCGYAGQSTPITFYYTVNSADNPTTINTSAASSGITPPGGAPVVTNGGAGTATRSATITPPSGGWRVGTYKFSITRENAGACSATQTYYIHISDGSRPDVTVPTTTVCYPGSGVVTATIPLPAVYKGVVNTSYFQDFNGRYRLTLVSKPAGAADPVFEPYNNTLFTNTSTTISNLNTQGEYVFKIKADTYNPSVGAFLDKEYVCSGTSLESNFSVFVSAQVGANAGSTQTLIGTSQTTFNANNPGAATGLWTLLSKPVGATDPVIATPSAYNTNVTGFNTPGTYTFRWTVTTGSTCSTTSDLTINVINAAAGGVSGADFWVKSDDAGTIATAWKDHSINANDIPAVGTWTLSAADRSHNFNPYTTGYSASKFFYNSTSVMNSTNGELANTNTSIFSAVRPTTNGTGRITGIDDDVAYASEPGVSIANGAPRQYEYYNIITSTDFPTTFNIGISNIFSAIANNSVANGGTSASLGGEKILGLNGSYQTTPFAGTNKFQIYGRNLRIGHAGWDAPGAFPGDIMEVVWYKRTLTANEQSRVNSYLAVKNGVTLNENYLSTASAVVWDRTINTGYNNNIFGIARDNITLLHQKQSGSVNNGQKLVISTTGFADSNAANSTDLLNDLQFLMTGDNGLKQSLAVPLNYTAGSNGSTNYRFESIWKVQNSGSIGTVTVAWPKGVKNLYLVQSSDAAFDPTDTFTPMTTEVTVNGVVYNTVNVTLANGQFFTFAGFGNAPGGVATGLSYWYRADKNATNTGAATDVTGLTDMWNGTTVAQLGTNALPKYVLGTSNYFNFNPGINFTVNTQSLGNISVQTLTSLNYDIFTLTKEGMIGTRFFNIGRNNTTFGGDNWDSPAFEPGGAIVRRTNTGAGPTYWANPGNPFEVGIPSIVYTTFTDVNLKKGVNGSTLLGPGTNHSAIGAVTGGHIFGRNAGTLTGGDDAGFVGHIGETIVYGAGTLSNVERRRVDSYLAIKYGITLEQVATDHYLDTDGNIVWNGASNTAYNSNIFGVSRDDIEAFEQKVSKSVNTGTILTVATVNDFVNPNQDATRTGFTNDKTYFLLGDNNVTVTPLVDITIGGNTWKRIQRTWLSQRKNTPGALYFEADLSMYGANFSLGSTVWMLVADDAAFTTNVQNVAGTYTNGKWVFSNNFNADNTQRYITFAGVAPSYCVTGDCNPNTFLNTSDPNTIEYDNMVSTFHSTLMRDASTGALMVWGERMANNGTGHVLSPMEVNSTNYPALTGDILKFAGGSNSQNIEQQVVLTTDGLFAWGGEAHLIHTDLTSSTAFQKIGVGTYGVNGGAPKADGLPDGVAPQDVKMLFGAYQTLALTTCSGEAWVLAQDVNKYSDGAASSAANDKLWHRVHTDATTPLNNVVAIRGSGRGLLMALTATGEVYTWGTNTRLGNGTAAANRAFATPMTIPAGVTPKMIGASVNTYYILGTNGNLYSTGEGTFRQLGNFSTANSNTWVQVQKSSTAGDYLTNVVWISPNEHDFTLAAINVLTADGRLWAWGNNGSQMLGGTGTSINPTEMPGSIPSANPYNIGKLNWTDKVIAVETGGHTSMIVKENNPKYGYVGHRVNGSMGDGTSTDAAEDEYNFADTPEIDLCGAPTQGACSGPDSDGDGIPDMCDMDDDNDGILDVFECSDLDPSIDFSIANGNTVTFNAPAADLGFIFDIYSLDNSFNLNINGVNLATNEIDFQSSHATRNIRFADGSQYGTGGIPEIWSMTGNSTTPIVRIIIGPNGSISMLGSKSTGGNLYPLELFNGTTFNTVVWNNNSSNTVIASQQVVGATNMTGHGTGFKKGFCDPDGDGISNELDLDSDNDGCLDAIEGSANFVAANLITAGGTVTVGIGSAALNQNLCGDGSCVDANGIPITAGAGQGIGSSQNLAINGCQTGCYKPGITTGTPLDTRVGITSLNRAGATDIDNWPMTRKGGWLALESKTKGFVPNRVAFSGGNPVGIAPANFVEGMMVYDTTNKCMKMYTLKDGDTSMAWHCITTQTCPD
ncbi:hypothetical protein AB1278_17810 [Chryseobacterium sp. NRRL B-14798]|uniref:hypothetical protein n=1 Tax=Chryseobacterium sp. NRRL B-14798 TaxID=3162880 RepID=UPI003D1BC05C